MRLGSRHALAIACALAAMGALGCGKNGAQCTAQVTAGDGTYRGVATGAPGAALADAAVKDACMQMCGATKATLIDGCAARCAADVAAGKIGAKTSCP